MSSLLVGFLAIFVFVIGYRFYGAKMVSLFGVEPKRKTPAEMKFDGIDYVPARHWTVLFGHHFASIAGAAPVVGPIIALSIWGWGPAILWVVLGTIFIGGVHDFGALMASVRHGGSSIADISSEVISRRAKLVFSAFVWLALILVIAVFIYLCAMTLTLEPQTVLPSIGLIPVAILVGYLLYNLRWNTVVATVIGLLLLLGLIFLGHYFPIDLGPRSELIWIWVLLIYCFVASVTPVQCLLQPRDYLSAFLLFAGVIFGYIGILVSKKSVSVPFFIGWGNGSPLWPLLFVTVACGAISGFHSLIASGTTAKQLPSEKYARRIGYGGMVAEGIVSVMAILCVASGIGNLNEIKSLLSVGGPGPIGVFGRGYGELTKFFLGGFGGAFAIMVLNSFILTTLDTATRINRYITDELFRVKNRFLSTAIVLAFAGWLGLSGKWTLIWPIFGSSNQLIAALTLLVITSWLLSQKKAVRFAFIPAVIMLSITISALFIQAFNFVRSGEWLLFVISVVLLGLSGFMLFESGRKLKNYLFLWIS